MFSPSENSPNTFFAELADVTSRPHCVPCNIELPKKGLTIWFDKTNKIASFWLLRCPTCHANHFVFNSTGVLPPPKAWANEPAANQPELP